MLKYLADWAEESLCASIDFLPSSVPIDTVTSRQLQTTAAARGSLGKDHWASSA